MQHPSAATIICGDKNDLDEKRIVALDPNFHQIVTQNTRKNKILSVVTTDLQSFFDVPKIIPPIPMVFLCSSHKFHTESHTTVKKGQS